jgi:phosphatidylserine/phosphatidylglycerophosphate/cardiolipin synthase-like enzyme
VVSASGINTQFAYWQKELLKLPSAHAIIHDKIVVIDPMSEDCVVITGSHNQGFRASYANDENFIIVRGHQPLAQAYATHVMDVYDHYRWRFTLKNTSIKDAFSGLDPTPAWQDKYYMANSSARRESLLWTGQLPALPNAPAPQVPMKPATTKAKPAAAKSKKSKSSPKKATAKPVKQKTKQKATRRSPPAKKRKTRTKGRKG